MKIMKAIILLVALFIILSTAAQSQPPADMKHVVDAVLTQAKSKALNPGSVKWDSIQSEMYLASERAKSVTDLRESLEIVLVALKDKHGKFYDPTTNSPIAEYPFHNNSRSIDQHQLNAIKAAEFHYQDLPNNIHYIRLASIPTEDEGLKYAELIRQAVDSLSKEEEPYWIVDLRYAVGGNMSSLFAGVGPLLDEGLVASTIDGKKQIRNLYTVHNGNFYDNQVRIGKFPMSIKDTRSLKVAVLTSRYTTGAAEVLALALNGRKNSKLFGEATAGQMVGTTEMTISSNLVMSISEIMFTDRKGTTYMDNIEPKVVVEFVPNIDIAHDKAISEASLWLTTTPVAETGTKVTMK
jgi:carboxyl-terminal processing protease